jgi:hypothetical protein
VRFHVAAVPGCRQDRLSSWFALSTLKHSLVLIALIALTSTVEAAPQLTITPTSFDYGAVHVGTTTAPKAFVVENTGNQTLVVTSITLGGANAADFAIPTDNATGNALPAGASATFFVTFTPSAAGARNATINVVSNASGPDVTVPVTGAGGAAVIAVTDLNFGVVPNGTTAVNSVTVSNSAANRPRSTSRARRSPAAAGSSST